MLDNVGFICIDFCKPLIINGFHAHFCRPDNHSRQILYRLLQQSLYTVFPGNFLYKLSAQNPHKYGILIIVYRMYRLF